MKVCKICKKLFKPNNSRQLCCSPECSRKNNSLTNRIKYHARKKNKAKPKELSGIDKKLIRYNKLGLSYGYGVVYDHPEWARVKI